MKNIATILMLFVIANPALTDEKPKKKLIDLKKLGAELKAAVKAGKMTEKEAFSKYIKAMEAMGMKKGMKKGKGMSDSFYSIVIGRLKSKDIELGEFTMEVDHVTGIYGDRSLKDTIIGKTVKVVGVSGPWLDKLLLIKRGETLKVRSGTLHGEVISLSPKATVLERGVPFDPKVYPIPPKDFRGFRGILTGTITSKSAQGYELTMKVDQVNETFKDSKATKPMIIKGRLLDLRGFYNEQFRKKFDDLRLGDRIRVGAVHSDPTIDPLNVTRTLEKAEK